MSQRGKSKVNSGWKRTFGGVSLTLGLVLTSGNFDGLTVQAQTAPAIVQDGYSRLNRGWVNDAIATFRQALQRYPRSLEARLGLATAYERAGQDANAWQAYQQVLTQDPKNRSALAAIGKLGGYRPEWQRRGIEALTTLLNLSPGDKAARAQRALLYGYQGEYTAALADYAPLLSANPAPEALLGAAQVYTYSGDYPEGLSLFNRYLATRSTIPNSAITAYALTLQKTGNPAEAVKILGSRLQSLKTLDDTAIQIRAALAIAYEANHQPQQALAVLEPLRGKQQATLPLARALSTIGRDARDEDLFEGAVGLYRQVLEQTTNPSPALLTEIADVFSESASAQADALSLYQQLIGYQPDNQSLQVKRLVLENQLGQLSKAELGQQLQAVLTPLPTDPAARRSLAIALLRLDSPDPGLLPVYQSLLQEGNSNPFFNYRIAQIYLQQGKLADARQALAAYTRTAIGAQDPASDLLLAEIDRQAGNLDASAQRYEALIARNLGDEITRDARRGLAGIRLAQGRSPEALALYNQLVAADANDLPSQLGQAAIAYQLKQIPQSTAEAALGRWLDAQANADPPPELFTLVGALPASPQRESLYDRLLAIEPYNIAINRRWIQIWAKRDPAKATARVNQLIAHNSNDIGVYFIQGELAQTLNDLPLAGRAYETILAKQPDNPDALSALGGVRFQQKRYEEARRLYKRVLALRPNDLETRQILADLSIAQDQPISALQQFRQIQQIHEAAGMPDASVSDQIQNLQVDILRRRGFQPYWERY